MRASLTRQRLGASVHDRDELVLVGQVSLQLVAQHVFAEDPLQDVCVLAVVAHPLLAALARHLHQAGVGAAQVGQGELLRAERDAAHRPVDARALVFAVGLEALSVLVDPAAVLAGSALRLGCSRREKQQERNVILSCSAAEDVRGCQVKITSTGKLFWLFLLVKTAFFPQANLLF